MPLSSSSPRCDAEQCLAAFFFNLSAGLFTDSICSNVLWHTTHSQAALFSSLTCLFPLLHNIPFIQPLSRLCSSKRKTESGVLWSYYPNNIVCLLSFHPHLLSPLFQPTVHHLPSLPFSLSSTQSSSSPSDLGFLDFCWHLAAVPFLPFLPARLHRMTGALVEVLLWPRLFLKGLLQLVSPPWVSLVPNSHPPLLPHKAAVSSQATCVRPQALI